MHPFKGGVGAAAKMQSFVKGSRLYVGPQPKPSPLAELFGELQGVGGGDQIALNPKPETLNPKP